MYSNNKYILLLIYTFVANIYDWVASQLELKCFTKQFVFLEIPSPTVQASSHSSEIQGLNRNST